MPTFRVLRKDYYIVDFEADNEEHAKEKMNTDDALLNSGSFCESVFIKKTLEIIEK